MSAGESPTIILRHEDVHRVPYKLARWSWHLSSWFGLLGEWLDEKAERVAS